MIKRLWLEASADSARPWQQALAAPEHLAPRRVTESTPLPHLSPDARWPLVGAAWFDDTDHLARFDDWAGPAATSALDVEEVVVRGADWLADRWARGGDRHKHLAVARRRAGLSPADFSRRWRAHAGSVGTVRIPEVARGCAYAQGHPVERVEGEWPHDAVTEVWFDDADALRTRVAWMAETLAASPRDELFGDRHLVAMREVVLDS